jgi:flagellar biosynthesis/type III secretory pathway chaperone
MMDRAQLFQHLRDQLEGEVRCHRRLLDLAEAKLKEVVAGNIAAFTELLRQEQEPMTLLTRLRQTRDRLLREAAETLGLDRAALRISQIVERCTDPLRKELDGRVTELRAVCERLRDLNDRIALLIRQSLGFVRDMLNTLIGETPLQGYDRRGGEAYARTGRGALVNQAG